jgi:tetratricopeptide (TPR) repeat protein
VLALLKRKDITIPGIFIVLHILSIIIFFVCARYRLPVIPLLIITGVFGIKSLITSFKEKVYRDVIIGFIVLVVFLIISNYNTGDMEDEYTADTYYNLGMHYVEELDMIEAESLFKKAVEIRPFYPEANGGLGLIYFERGEYKKALKYYQNSLQKHPEFAKSLINSGTLYIRMGNTEKAIEYYERALNTQPQNENIKRYLFLANKRLEEINKEDVGENIKELLKIKDEYKNDPRYLNALGVAYINEGLYRAGAEYLSRAVLLMPENPVPHYNLGIALMNTGDFEYATKEFQEVLKLDPGNESAKEYISRMREDMNKENDFHLN